jgi:copper chaperone NosL
MTIVDRIHGAELVTKKGKVYVFDAVECMLNDLNDRPNTEVAMFLVNHYKTPAELIDATQATYLVSENLPSPMGGFLTAFSSETEAAKAQDEYGGKLYDWDGINQAYKSEH